MFSVIQRKTLTAIFSRVPFSIKERTNNLNLARFCAVAAMNSRIPLSEDFIFRQLFDEKSWTYSYILGDVNSKEAIIIDPGN
jgi:hypothetical protein